MIPYIIVFRQICVLSVVYLFSWEYGEASDCVLHISLIFCDFLRLICPGKKWHNHLVVLEIVLWRGIRTLDTCCGGAKCICNTSGLCITRFRTTFLQLTTFAIPSSEAQFCPNPFTSFFVFFSLDVVFTDMNFSSFIIAWRKWNVMIYTATRCCLTWRHSARSSVAYFAKNIFLLLL